MTLIGEDMAGLSDVHGAPLQRPATLADDGKRLSGVGTTEPWSPIYCYYTGLHD